MISARLVGHALLFVEIDVPDAGVVMSGAAFDADLSLVDYVRGATVHGRRWDLDGTSSVVRGAEARIFSPFRCWLPHRRFPTFAGDCMPSPNLA